MPAAHEGGGRRRELCEIGFLASEIRIAAAARDVAAPRDGEVEALGQHCTRHDRDLTGALAPQARRGAANDRCHAIHSLSNLPRASIAPTIAQFPIGGIKAVIASEAKQSRFTCACVRGGDCFAPLAMTFRGPGAEIGRYSLLATRFSLLLPLPRPHVARRLPGPAPERVGECAHLLVAEQPGDLRHR